LHIFGERVYVLLSCLVASHACAHVGLWPILYLQSIFCACTDFPGEGMDEVLEAGVRRVEDHQHEVKAE
jgi:hypothetical protein